MAREDLALGDDLRHRGMVLWEPIGGTIPIGDLRAGEREFRPRERMQRHVVQHLLRSGLCRWSARRHWRCEAIGPWSPRIGCLRRCGRPERQARCATNHSFIVPSFFESQESYRFGPAVLDVPPSATQPRRRLVSKKCPRGCLPRRRCDRIESWFAAIAHRACGIFRDQPG